MSSSLSTDEHLSAEVYKSGMLRTRSVVTLAKTTTEMLMHTYPPPVQHGVTWAVVGTHVAISNGPLQLSPTAKDIVSLGDTVAMKVTGTCVTSSVVALRMEGVNCELRSEFGVTHLVLYKRPGARAEDSNQIRNWSQAPEGTEPVVILGNVEELPPEIKRQPSKGNSNSSGSSQSQRSSNHSQFSLLLPFFGTACPTELGQPPWSRATPLDGFLLQLPYFVHMVSQPAILHDHNAIIVSINDAALVLFGRTQVPPIGGAMGNLMSPGVGGRYNLALQQIHHADPAMTFLQHTQQWPFVLARGAQHVMPIMITAVRASRGLPPC